MDVEAYLRRRYENQIADIEIVEKEDLDLVSTFLHHQLYTVTLPSKIWQCLLILGSYFPLLTLLTFHSTIPS